MTAFFDADKSLRTFPTTRAAYSDRTSWMMSEMSALAYLKFEGQDRFGEVFDLVRTLGKRVIDKEIGKDLSAQIEALETRLQQYITDQIGPPDSPPPGHTALNDALGTAGFVLVETFNEGGTQAFLAKRSSDKVAILAFRGTEANSWKDVKTDLKFRFYEGQDGAKMHRGFRTAYDKVSDKVKQMVNQHTEGYTLYVTGHSLGGALAIIAAKRLERNTLAACYTFGSPRVGNEEFGEEIRAPIYRIVNAADGVPRLPGSWFFSFIAFVVSFARPAWGDWIEKNFCGYMHQGDMRYLTACKDDCTDLHVIPNLSMPFRAWRMLRRMIANGPAVAGADHRIDQYRTKLLHHAKQRALTAPATTATPPP